MDIWSIGGTGLIPYVGSTKEGEWLEYTVNVAAAGDYTMGLRVVNGTTSTKQLRIFMNGEDISGPMTVPSTPNDWEAYSIVSKTVTLTTGQQVMRLQIDSGSFNVDYVDFQSTTPDANQALVILSSAITSATVGTAYSYDVNATDKNASDTLTYALTTKPIGMSIDELTGLISWTPAPSQAGNQDVTVTVTDNGTPSLAVTQNFTISVASITGGGISGTDSVASSNVNLTLEGAADWVHWGRSDVMDVDRKAGVVSQIENLTPIKGAQLNRGANSLTSYKWTDGKPVALVTNTKTGLRAYARGKGFEFSVPADSDMRTLKVYVGVSFVGAKLEAILSDGSSAPYVTHINRFSGTASRVVTINYQAASDGQFLKVRYTLNNKPLADYNGWIGLDAAVLIDKSIALSLPYVENFTSTIASDWKVTDMPGAPSNWFVTNGQFLQESLVANNEATMQGGYHLGTYASLNPGLGLSDYKFTATIFPLADSGEDVGAMIRLNQATDSYIRLSFSSANGFGRLETKSGKKFKTLMKDARGYKPGESLQITMEVNGPIVTAKLNGEKLFGAFDSNIEKGTIGLYCRDKCAFDEISIQKNDALPSIVISEPASYSVSPDFTFNVGAVVLNMPANAKVIFQLDGQSGSCTDSSDEGHRNLFTAACTASSPGSHELVAILQNQFGVQIDNDTNPDVSVGDNFVAIGDDISVGLDDSTARDGISQNGRMISSLGYEAKLMDQLEMLQSKPVIIHKGATSGDTTSDVAYLRMSSILERHHDANKAIVMLGINDTSGTTFVPSGLDCTGSACNGTFKGNMQTIIDSLTSAGKSVIVSLVPPRFGDPFQSPYESPASHSRNVLIRDEYNAVIKHQLSNRQVGPDLYNYFLGSDNKFYLYETNLHPNALGYDVIAYLLRNSISGELGAPFIVSNICLRLSQGGACVSPLTYKENLMELGSKYFIDQNYTLLSNIPGQLLNGRWIMTSDADRYQANTDYLSFSIPELSTMYVAYDARATTLPQWLSNDFRNTGLNLETDNPTAPVLKLYVKNDVLGDVTLGGANATVNGAMANYSVIIVKK